MTVPNQVLDLQDSTRGSGSCEATVEDQHLAKQVQRIGEKENTLKMTKEGGVELFDHYEAHVKQIRNAGDDMEVRIWVMVSTISRTIRRALRRQRVLGEQNLMARWSIGELPREGDRHDEVADPLP